MTKLFDRLKQRIWHWLHGVRIELVREHGITALKIKYVKQIYSPEFKLNVVGYFIITSFGCDCDERFLYCINFLSHLLLNVNTLMDFEFENALNWLTDQANFFNAIYTAKYNILKHQLFAPLYILLLYYCYPFRIWDWSKCLTGKHLVHHGIDVALIGKA